MPIEDEFNPSADNPFIGKQPDFDEEVAARTRTLVPVETADTLEQAKKPGFWAELSPKERRVALGLAGSAAALIAVGIAAGPTIAERLDGPDYSPQTTTYTVENGDSWYSVAESIPGHDNDDTRDIIDHLQENPANAGITDLHPGQTISVPVEIKE